MKNHIETEQIDLLRRFVKQMIANNPEYINRSKEKPFVFTAGIGENEWAYSPEKNESLDDFVDRIIKTDIITLAAQEEDKQ